MVKMCIYRVEQSKCKLLNRSSIGCEVKGVLTKAKNERRLICGLLPAIAHLEQNPENAVVCIVPQIRPGNAAMHMQNVLLQAFCYENYIPVIQVDGSDKLAQLCDVRNSNSKKPAECFCAIVIKENGEKGPLLSPSEQTLTDFYECTLEEYPRPVVQLPTT